MTNTRFGWHSGTMTCRNVVVENDMTINGDLTFGDASTDSLTVNGAATFNANVVMAFAATEFLNITNSTLGASTKGVYVEMESGSATAGCRQGAVQIELGRSTVMTGTDGNPDVALKITCSDWSDGGSGYARVRGLDLKAQNDGATGNSSVFINAAYITAECATGMANSGNMSVCELNMKNNGTIAGENIGLLIQDQSQGATTGAAYGIKITASNYAIVREFAISIESTGGSWTNVLHLVDDNHTNFIDADVEGGCVAATRTSPDQTAICDGGLKILVGSKTLYIPAYNALTTS